MPTAPRGGARPSPGDSVARRANYGFEKRQKELQKQKKKEEKAEKKRLRKEEGAVEQQGALSDDVDVDRTAAE
jgi:hypothetical protein